MTDADAEKLELERAVGLLGRTTRHGRLLEYLGTRRLEQRQAQLTEFDIARDVFGRSIDSFDPAEDAVVRVETHRLRKKLRDLYAHDVRTTGVQISIPAGTYVPEFPPIPAQHPHPTTSVPPPLTVAAPAVAPAAAPRTLPRWTLVAGAAAVLATLLLAASLRSGGREPRAAQPAPAAPAPATPARSGTTLDSLHLLAGYDGGEVIDSSAIRWTPDRFFSNGGSWPRKSGFIRNTSRPFLFKTWRSGEFSYDIPLAEGNYELRLYFVSGQPAGEEKMGAFNVLANGQPLLTSYDILMSAGGADTADERVFRDVRPSADGILRLWFVGETSSPILNALEVVPGTPGKLQPIRLLTQRTSYVDHTGQRWRADDYYQNGFLVTDRSKVQGTADPDLFTAERYGHFRYSIPVDRRGRYTVVLHFAEFYFGPQLPGGGGAGSRVFNVYCNGQTLLRDFDVYKEAGSLRLLTKSFPHIEPSPFGKINLTFEPSVNNATVSGIEIIDESGS